MVSHVSSFTLGQIEEGKQVGESKKVDFKRWGGVGYKIEKIRFN